MKWSREDYIRRRREGRKLRVDELRWWFTLLIEKFIMRKGK